MTRRARAGMALTIALGIAATCGFVAHGMSVARENVAQAEARLFAPIVEAPELTGLSASRARAELLAAEAAPMSPDVSGLAAYADAIIALQRGNLPRAAAESRRARALLGATADVLVLEGVVARAATRDEDAAAHVAAALRIAPDHTRARLLDADLALDAGEGGRAVTRLEALTARHPEIGALHARLGRARELVGDADGAERAYRAALGRNGRDPSTHVNLGRVLGLRGDLVAARASFESARRLAPNDAGAWLGLCLGALTRGDVPETTSACTRAADLDRGVAEPLVALGDLARAQGDLAAAITRYEQALARVPTHAAALTKLGHARFGEGDLVRAEAAYRAAITRAPSLSAAHNGLGVVLGFSGRPDEARAALERAAALDVRDSGPLMNLGLLAERTGDAARARQAYEAALERDPDNGDALDKLLRL